MVDKKITLYSEDYPEKTWIEEYCEPLGVLPNSDVIEITVTDVRVISIR